MSSLACYVNKVSFWINWKHLNCIIRLSLSRCSMNNWLGKHINNMSYILQFYLFIFFPHVFQHLYFFAKCIRWLFLKHFAMEIAPNKHICTVSAGKKLNNVSEVIQKHMNREIPGLTLDTNELTLNIHSCYLTKYYYLFLWSLWNATKALL